MTAFALILRGINVGGHGKLPMADLRKILEELGCQQVSTYIQSGNAVFLHEADPDTLARQIEKEISTRHGFLPKALVVPASALRAAHDNFPFPEAYDLPKTGHIWFFSPPARPDLDKMKALAAPSERYALGDMTFNLHAPAGIGRSKLAAKVENLLGVEATARNLNTVKKLADMAAGLAP